MRNIYLVQPNNSLSGSLFLPYSAGTIAAYSFSFEDIKNNYNLCDFIFTKDEISDTVNKIENPYIVGFSCYMWNVEYNLALAKAVKERFPDSIIAFGGPQIPDDVQYLENYDFIDILMHGEGEIAFYSILKSKLYCKALNEIDNISYRENSKIFKTNKNTCVQDVDYPSPYTMGYFDKIINDPKYDGVQFDTVLETNRGCPYKCIYCCWAGTEKSFRKLPIQRVKGDLLWMAENKIAFCVCADSNFGIFDRDEEIADYVVELKKKYGYPEKFETTAAKNKDDLTFRINSKLNTVGLNRGISVAVQSMSSDVLNIVGRKNMSVDNLAQQLKMYRQQGMYTYTDIILGLPGETLESFTKGLFSVIEAGQHYSININRCEFLPNTIMYSKDIVEKYKIKTILSHLCQNHSEVGKGSQFGSRSELVVETSTMSMSQWREALRISTCAQSFHCMGFLRFFAVYLRKAKNVSYYDFYTSLYNWIENKSVKIKEILDSVCKSIDTFLKNESDLEFHNKKFGNIYWSFEEGLFLSCVAQIQEAFTELEGFLKEKLDDQELFWDLFNYQKAVISHPLKDSIVLNTKYDWYDYFENLFNQEYLLPIKKDTVYIIDKIDVTDWISYAKEIVWYGKRNDKMINKSIRYQ